MLDDVIHHLPNEACGLLAGKNNHVLFVTPITNELNSSIRFRMNPEEQLQAFNYIENHGWELLGIYHSHPNGPAEPSPTDINEAYYPDVIHLIWSPRAGEWSCNGYYILDGNIIPVELNIL